MKDYYYILGIKRDASLDEIKTAYRKLSHKFHPDKNDGDTFFEERFKEIQEAYEILSDEYKRKKYDLNFNNFGNQSEPFIHFQPVIENFQISPTEIYGGETVTITWKVINANNIFIDRIGTVENMGEKNLIVNNINSNEFISVSLTATNTYVDKTISQSIKIINKSFVDIKSKLINEIKNKDENTSANKQNINISEKKNTLLNLELSWIISGLILFIFVCWFIGQLIITFKDEGTNKKSDLEIVQNKMPTPKDLNFLNTADIDPNTGLVFDKVTGKVLGNAETVDTTPFSFEDYNKELTKSRLANYPDIGYGDSHYDKDFKLTPESTPEELNDYRDKKQGISDKFCNASKQLTFTYYFNQGKEKMENKNFQSAIENFTKAVETHTIYFHEKNKAYGLRGNCYEKLGSIKKAKADWQKAAYLGNIDVVKKLEEYKNQF